MKIHHPDGVNAFSYDGVTYEAKGDYFDVSDVVAQEMASHGFVPFVAPPRSTPVPQDRPKLKLNLKD